MAASDNRLVVKFQGGLGNQLYEYAFCEWLKRQYPDCAVLADLSYYKIRMAHDDLGIWNIFPSINLNISTDWEIFKTSGQIPIVYGGKGADRLNSLRKKVNASIFQNREKSYISSISNTDTNLVRKAIADGKKYFEGYWQNIDYFIDNLNDIRKKLAFPVDCDMYITDGMLQENAVSLHVRRGDYVGSIYEKEVGMSYYREAVEFVDKRISQAKYFIFSDDKEYAESAFDWIENKTVVTGYDNKLAHVDMFLMSKIKNNIIANSTFSLWAAYLNSNHNALVVYPEVESLQKKTLPGWLGICNNSGN